MRKVISTALIVMLGVNVNAFEIHQEPIKHIPPLSVHDFHTFKKPKKFKIIILPLISEDDISFSGFKIEVKINELPEFFDEEEN